MKSVRFSFLLFAIMLMMAACNSSNTSDTGQKTGPEYTSEYVCPMHCSESGSENPGQCPVCGMDYVKNEDHVSDGHTHTK